MARRTVLTSRQRSALFALPQREADLLRHYTLSDEDLQNIGARRRPSNKLGFAAPAARRYRVFPHEIVSVPSSGLPVAFSVSTAGRGIPHCVFHPGSSGSHRPAHARSRSSSATGRSVSPLCFARPAWSRSLTPWHDPHTRISPGWKVSQ